MDTANLIINVPFFTALDPDARIKGSCDPLGFELLWTALGRDIVGNLTTVTRSVRQFSTLLAVQVPIRWIYGPFHTFTIRRGRTVFV